jgi:small subunit ribosomal protein S18
MSRRNNRKKPVPTSDYLKENSIEAVDYKDVDLLRRFISSNMKIVPRRRSGLSAKSQRKIAKAIKQARIAGLLPFVGK